MPQGIWSAKRERQFKHIKESLIQGGREPDLATEIATPTVNKVRAQRGEQHAHAGAAGRTYAQLYQEARLKNIKGRSAMNKVQLEQAVDSPGGSRRQS
ncbi:plasmid stabilization protein [Undibacterium sp. JH2W]|uniref:plasmid stabilization protein n=1 Tax=Undibacterium sp. JH2W TaxID=3413037 RepID=UPI003BEFE16E